MAICVDRQSRISPEDTSGMGSATRLIFSNSEVNFENNNAGCGGGISAINLNIELKGTIRFINNEAWPNGGAI